MISLTVNLDGDGASKDLAERGLKMIHLGNGSPPIRLTYLSQGMASGKPSCALIFELPDGKHYVIAEISAALLVAGARLVETQAKKEGIVL